MRAIDGDALCEDLLDRWSIADTRKEELIRAVMADIVTPIVVAQPTITPERKRGKWINVTNDESLDEEYECSVCGYELFYSNPTKFCPNCGAEMTEGKDV